MDLLIENVRSFEGRHHIPLKPLSLMVGENSTGKSTVLAMLTAALNPEFPVAARLFNTPPFDLGTFSTIATHRGGKYGRAKKFRVGMSEASNDPCAFAATFIEGRGQPAVSHLSIEKDGESLDLHFSADSISGSARLNLNGERKAITERKFHVKVPPAIPSIRALIATAVVAGGETPLESAEALPRVFELTRMSPKDKWQRAIPLAPIRMKPRRTFDQADEQFDPEGQHVPYLLSRLERDETREQMWSALRNFGKEAGLFSDIQIKNFGDKPGDPFQIQVKTGGPWVNLMDVGYGVSQSLPIVVQSALGRARDVVLLQQPEVHLHPRAQAALGTLLARLIGAKERFMIETHSDYLVDRVRIEIAQGTVKASDVQILFFERTALDSKIYPLAFDEKGNIENAPRSFREFFIKEEMRLLARGK